MEKVKKTKAKSPVLAEELDEVEDVSETISSFRAKVDAAKMAGDDWVETTPAVIAYFNRRGLNGSKFFIFEGIKVCENGTREAVEAECNASINTRLHGPAEGTIVGR